MVSSALRLIVGTCSLTLISVLVGCSGSKDGANAPGGGGSNAGSSSGGTTGNAPDSGVKDAGLVGGSGGGSASGGGSVNSGSGGHNGGSASGGATAGGSGGSTSTGSGGFSSAGGSLGSTGGSSSTGSGGRSAAGSGGSSSGVGGGAGAAASGSGGRAGGGGGRSGTGTTGECPTNAIFCADFEAGTLPAQAAFYPEYLRSSLSTYLTIDSTNGINSARSAKFSGTSFSQMLGVLTGTATFWTRVYLRSDIDINVNAGHATYVAATDGNGDPNMGEQIRVGEHQCQLELNRRSDDKELLSNGGVYQCMGGVVLRKNVWYCLETYYDGPGREVRVLVDSAEVTALHATDWGPYNYGMFKFGFENYSSQARTMWYDDVAVAPQQIGCH